MYTNKRITKATVKSFINKYSPCLYFKSQSSFSDMSDMVETIENPSFKKVIYTENNIDHTLGIQGAWFVGQSRDSFRAFNDGVFTGIHVYNCCGSFTIAVRLKEERRKPDTSEKDKHDYTLALLEEAAYLLNQLDFDDAAKLLAKKIDDYIGLSDEPYYNDADLLAMESLRG